MAVMNIHEIFQYLPHRYPFLLVDRVLALEPNETIIAIKNVSINEHFFQGHFPISPVMPGVLILEALAQAAAILAYKSTEDLGTKNSLFYLGSIENARFKKIVQPGDCLELAIKINKKRANFWRFEAVASVNQEVVCTASMTSAQGAVQNDK